MTTAQTHGAALTAQAATMQTAEVALHSDEKGARMPPTIAPSPLLRDIALDAPDLLVLDEVQQRVAIDLEKVHEYAELYKDGRDLGRLVVFHTYDEDEDVHEFYLADGFHRRLAALEAGLTTLPAEVQEGTSRDAIFYATSCNLHGKPLSNADKRKRVETLLHDPEWCEWSDGAIARHCGVTQPFVSSIRRSLKTVLSDEAQHVQSSRTYTDRHGNIATMNTIKIGQRAPGTPPASAPLPTSNATSSAGSTGSPVPAIFTEMPETEAAEEITRPPVQFGSGDWEWYTPPPVIAKVREVFGGTIDLDPASCDAAQQTVDATTYYTVEDDGLRHPWHGRIFLNPPYKTPEVARFVGKLVEERDADHITEAIVLVNNATQTDWFQFLAQRADLICFPDGKIPFTHATRDDAAGPCYGQALIYVGPHVKRFAEVFGSMGLLMQVLSAKEAGPQLDLGPLIRKLNSNIRKATKTRATPPPAPVPPGTIAEQILGVLQTAPDGLTNAQIARALGKKQTDTHKPLERLVRHGKARKEGVMYFYVEQKAEVPA